MPLIEPKFIYFNPPADLADYIYKMYLIEAPFAGIRQYIPAWTSPLLVLQYAEPVYSDINGRPEVVEQISVSGMVSKKYGFDTPADEIKLFMVEFTPAGMYALFRERLDLLADTSADATVLIPRRKRQQLSEALSETEDTRRKAELVINFLRTLMPDRPVKKAAAVDFAVKEMQSTGYNMKLSELADEMAMSERNLRRVFKEVTGLSFKKFQNIKRFNRIFNSLMSGNEKLFKEMVFNDYYYDQSHFIKDFKSFTGYTPEQLPYENFFFHHVLTR